MNKLHTAQGLKGKVAELENALQEATKEIDAIFRAGKIPLPCDYADMDRLKKELKGLRRMLTMNARRSESKLNRKVSILMAEDEFKQLSERSEKKGMILSKYIRQLLKKGLKVEEDA
jgi:hypothetical protein